MTDKTPIEKAAEEIKSELNDYVTGWDPSPMTEAKIADIIRRRLEREVPEKADDHPIKEVNHMRRGHNQCRRDIGLRDEEETEV